jgi:hypothetical protein
LYLYNQLHHRNQSESYKCTSVQPTTPQKSVWELQMYLCTTNYITEISLRATNVPLYNQLHHRNQSESYTCTSVQLTTSQKSVWELQMYLCTTNYVTEIRQSYKCTSVQQTTSQKSVWELQMYLCTTNYITEISLRATHVPLFLLWHSMWKLYMYLCFYLYNLYCKF